MTLFQCGNVRLVRREIDHCLDSLQVNPDDDDARECIRDIADELDGFEILSVKTRRRRQEVVRVGFKRLRSAYVQ